ncbi:protein-tyrosine phosphatase-like protein [Polychytrium aggregatum]|uniref:protein-tyrosine phosphatase-like protein n=1 Tax=Polychytrium aggregatum TaxID=110093 RepID=UPI0022FDDA3B|nr:protein-tyrosine phosphatase-like protein [Polychytrium aggregatum]KAI9202454.1 protein-tyrosine phosphatase-like protein [Polychytrium aggregatum]
MTKSATHSRASTAAGTDTSASRVPNSISVVEYKQMRFLIFDAPSNRTLDAYLAEMARHNVTDLVRVCDPTYDRKIVEGKGIAVHDWPFPDGDPPPDSVIENWLSLVYTRFGVLKEKGKDGACPGTPAPETSIAVHCVAGLGRAPILVAMALIEAGLAPLDSVIYVRERRRGAINARQLKFIEGYKRRGLGKSSGKEKGCTVS